MKKYAIILFLCFATTANAQNKGVKNRNAVDPVDRLMIILVKELTLDGFQEAVIHNSLKIQVQKLDALRVDPALSNPEKKDAAIVIMKKSDDEIKAVLNKDQVKKYSAYKDKVRGKKKKNPDSGEAPESDEFPELTDTPD